MKFSRKFTTAGQDVYSTVEWVQGSSEISGKDGEVIFSAKDLKVPKSWGQLAVDIWASRYARRAGVPNLTNPVHEEGIPRVLQQGGPRPDAVLGGEKFVARTIWRIVGCWTYWGYKRGYFDSEEDAYAFRDELTYMMLHQMAAPNSPQWFNTGLHWAYGITGSGQGPVYLERVKASDGILKDAEAQGEDVSDGKVTTTIPVDNEYEHPMVHACFIQPVLDNLVKPGGIMDLFVKEATLFKYGAGTGTNVSPLRGKGEPLSGGGVSSGLMSWLPIGNAVAGAIKSGGTTRRAAKMLSCDLDHPDVIPFIRWKAREGLKIDCLVAGRPALTGDRARLADAYDLQLDYDFNGEAVDTVNGQNANLSVRASEDFFKRLKDDGEWDLLARTAGRFGHRPDIMASLPAKELWHEICQAAWHSGDPGIQYHDTINDWHTCPVDGPIVASNPCSEFMFLEDTACNLASLNLLKFKTDTDNPGFDIEAFQHAVRLWTTVLDISIEMASYPSHAIAMGTHKYRALGLGFTNLGATLMQYGMAYDSGPAATFCGAVSSIMTATAYSTSAELARDLGTFPRFEANKNDMMRVLRNHAYASGLKTSRGEDFKGITVKPIKLHDLTDRLYGDEYRQDDVDKMVRNMADASATYWLSCLEQVVTHGARNAQVTLLAPAGTISFVMDCDTTGIEADFALVKTKKLSGGGVLKIVNQSVRPALKALGYEQDQINEIVSSLEADGNLPEDLIDPAHLSVFDCSGGDRSLSPDAHLKMMAAAQPFLSGAISKTVNMSHDSTIEDISKAYHKGHDLGLKAVAVYRDGCKMSQPLTVVKKSEEIVEVAKNPGVTARLRLPDTRDAIVHKFSVGNHEGYFIVGLFPDTGLPGELFIEMSKEGSTVGGMMDMFATAISLCLQYRVPLKDLVRKFSHQRFEPHGMTRNKDIPIAMSIVDYIFRWLGIRFLEGYRESNIPHIIRTTGPKEGQKVDVSEKVVAVQTDAPACDKCGALTLRSGVCYICPNCGHQNGCG